MEIKIQKWENLHAIRIPINLLNELGTKENDVMNIEKRDGDIVLSKSKHMTISDRIEKYT